MTVVFLPDNTVLCNFAAVSQLDLLRRLLDGNGQWTEAVAFEASNSESYFPDLATIRTDGWLGDPLEIDDSIEERQVEGIRKAAFGGTSAEPLKHLGESQTIFIIRNWDSHAGATWISDDQESLRYARRQMIGVKETKNLIAEAAQLGWLTAAEGYAMMQQMAAQGRNPSMPASATELMNL